jgi:guanylate kinase
MDFKGKLFVFSAPSGSGKSTIVNHLLSIDELNLAFSISATSRAPRGEEKDGEHYYFMSADEFKSHIEKDDFLEWEEVYQNNFYGTLKSEVARIWKMGKHVVFDIDVIGGLNIKKQFPEQTLSIFIMPPSVEELRNRLVKRSTETAEKIEMRVAKAAKELESASSFDVVITNDELDKALVEAEQTVANFIQS